MSTFSKNLWQHVLYQPWKYRNKISNNYYISTIERWEIKQESYCRQYFGSSLENNLQLYTNLHKLDSLSFSILEKVFKPDQSLQFFFKPNHLWWHRLRWLLLCMFRTVCNIRGRVLNCFEDCSGDIMNWCVLVFKV